jgi:predicted AAA+ superfamily ATPase
LHTSRPLRRTRATTAARAALTRQQRAPRTGASSALSNAFDSLECATHLTLRRRYGEVFDWRARGEVDFVA